MMQQAQAKIPEMVNQSMEILQKPSEVTFEKYEQSGTVTDAAIYVGAAAVIAGVLGIFTGGLSGIITGLLGTLANFFVFSGLVYYIGKQQGGTGTFDEVAYTFSLFIAPLGVIGGVLTLLMVIPLLGVILALVGGLALIVAQLYFAFIAVRSSMNLVDQNKSLITLGGAILGSIVVQLLIGAIFGGG